MEGVTSGSRCRDMWHTKRIQVVAAALLAVLTFSALAWTNGHITDDTKRPRYMNSASLADSIRRDLRQQGIIAGKQSGGSRLNALVELLMNANVSTIDDLTSPYSPQQLAVKFLAFDDRFELDYEQDFDAVVQRYVMVVIFYSMGGEGWPNRLNFLDVEASECQWFVTALSGGIVQYGTSCDETTGAVQALILHLNFDLYAF